VHATSPALPEVHDARRGPRFIVDPPIQAVLGSHQVQIYNIAEGGIQIEVPEKLPRSMYAEIRFSLPISPRVIRLEARVAWCRQARKDGLATAWPYRCGLRIEGLTAFTVESLAALLRAHVVRPDRNSLERKRRLIEERRRANLTLAPEPPARPALPPPITLEDCIARVQAARAVLRNDLALSAHSLAAGRRAWTGPDANAEVIAIWQYLDRVVDPSIVSVVLELYPE
jgi:hypothetical protein